MAMRVFAGLVNVKTVVRMLDDRHAQPARFERGNQLFDKRGFARSGVACEANDVHCGLSGWANSLYF